MKRYYDLIKKKHIMLLLISILGTIPILIFNFIPQSHDILFHLSRIKGILDEINMGYIFSPIYHHFLNNLGYASPLFYADIFLYPFSIILKYTNLVFTYKVLIFIINYVTVYVINHVLEKYYPNNKYKYLFIIFYILMPYRMVDLYLRGSIGEVLAFIFIPFVIIGLKEIFYGNLNKYYYLVIGMTGLLYSHLISAFLVGIYILFYIILNIKKIFQDKRYLSFIKAVLLTTLLSSAFLFPLIEQLIDRNFYIYNLGNIFYNNASIPIYKIFLEIPLPSKEWLPLGIGVIFLYLIILGFKHIKKQNNNIKTYLILGILFLLCSTNLVPNIIYDKFLYIIQYNWRFYLLASISLYFFALETYKYFNKKEMSIFKKIIVISSITVLTVSLSNNLIYSHITTYSYEYLGYYEYLPKGITFNDVDKNLIKDSSNNDIDYKIKYDNDRLILNYENNNYKDTIITLPLLYYKGYKTNKNNEIINNNGLVSLKLNKISDEIIVYYDITNIHLIGYIITSTTIIIMVIYYVRKSKIFN